MQIGKYLTQQLSYDTYSFNSIGPKGSIELRIVISKDDKEKDINIYNLAFGVWNSELNDIDDTVELKNGDMDQILATVAHTALAFLNEHPESLLYVQGSNAIRTRKYQMGITKYIGNIPVNLRVLGLIDQKKIGETNPSWEWELFQTGTNYQAFLFYSK